MTSFAKVFNRSEVHALAEMVIQGKVISITDGFVPGTDGQFFGQCYEISTYNVVKAQEKSKIGKTIIFWTLDKDLTIKIGTEIEASLVFDEAPKDVSKRALMPFPSSKESVIELHSKKTVHSLFLEDVAVKISDLPAYFSYQASTAMSYRAPDIEKAARRWQDAASRFTYNIVSCNQAEGDCMRSHYLIAHTNYIPPKISGNSQPLARTDLGASFGSRLLIRFNTSYSWSLGGYDASGESYLPEPDEFDFFSVLLHEIGHGIGIGHLPDNPDAVMFPSFPSGETRRVLTIADINSVRALY